MRKMKVFDLNLAEAAGRFYLMMVGTLILGFLGQMTLATIFAFLLAIRFILGVSYRKTDKKANVGKLTRISEEEKDTMLRKAA